MALQRVHHLSSMFLIVHPITVENQCYWLNIFVLERPNVHALEVPSVLLSGFVLMLQTFNALVLQCFHLQFPLPQLVKLNPQILVVLSSTMKRTIPPEQ